MKIEKQVQRNVNQVIAIFIGLIMPFSLLANEEQFELSKSIVRAVDLAEATTEFIDNETIRFSGRITSQRAALSIRYPNVDLSSYNYLKIIITPETDISPSSSFKIVQFRNNRTYYKLDRLSLNPLMKSIETGQENSIVFDISNVPRENINELRIYLNSDKRMVDKELKAELKIYLDDTPVVRLKSLELSSARKRVFNSPYIAARTHIKYTLHSNWFFDPDRYAERTLFLDRSLGNSYNTADTFGIGGKGNFLRSLELIKQSSCNGMAMLTVDTSETYINRTIKGMKYADSANMKQVIVPEISIFSLGTGDDYLDAHINNSVTKLIGPDAVINRLITKAIKSPSTFKFNGKTVISSYNADILPPEYWRDFKETVKKRTGQDIVFLVELRKIFYDMAKCYRKNNGLTVKEINELKSYLNSYLETCDGILFAGQNHLQGGNHKFFYKFYKDMIIPIINEVMKESQNNDKILGLGISKCYLNHLSGDVMKEEGTLTSRRMIESALSINPDYLVLVEWNEINERTQFEPTVCDGKTNMRLLRHYFHQNEKTSSLPGDDLSIPNIVLSYRTRLAPGEKMIFEVLNIPDETSKDENSIELRLRNEKGEIVKSFIPAKLKSDRIGELRFTTYADSDIKNEFILIPELLIKTADGKEIAFDKGFTYINISATELRDEKYYKHPLRDLPKINYCKFSAKLVGNRAEVTADIKSKEKLAYVEILRNFREVYACDPSGEYDLADDEMLIRLTWNGWKTASEKFKDMTVSCFDASIRKVTLSNRAWGRNVKWKQKDSQSIVIEKLGISPGAIRGLYIKIKYNDKSKIKIKTGDLDFSMELAELRKVAQHRLSPGHGLNFMLEDFTRIADLPPILNESSVSFSQILPHINKRDVLMLRFITISGRIFRSEPIRFTDRRMTTVNCWSDRENIPTLNKVQKAAAIPIDYEFDPSAGALLKARGFDSRFYARLGGNCNYADPFFDPRNFPDSAASLQPQWIDEKTLRFNGNGNHIVIPRYASPARAFTIDMELKYEKTTKAQILLSSYSKTAGALTVILEKSGSLKIRYVREDRSIKEFNTPKIMSSGKWIKLSIAFDLSKFKIIVDDDPTLSYPCKGKPVKMTALVFGGVGNGKKTGYFKGELKKLKIGFQGVSP